MKSAVAIRHVHFEDLGAFAPAIHAAGYEVHYCDVGEQDLSSLDPLKMDLLIVLGVVGDLQPHGQIMTNGSELLDTFPLPRGRRRRQARRLSWRDAPRPDAHRSVIARRRGQGESASAP